MLYFEPMVFYRLVYMRKYLLWLCMLQISSAVCQEHHEITSRLKTVHIIALGEISHGIESVNSIKGTLCRFLHTQGLGQAVIFESPFVGSMSAYLEGEETEERMGSFLYPFWNTASVKSSLESFTIRNSKNSDRL